MATVNSSGLALLNTALQTDPSCVAGDNHFVGNLNLCKNFNLNLNPLFRIFQNSYITRSKKSQDHTNNFIINTSATFLWEIDSI